LRRMSGLPPSLWSPWTQNTCPSQVFPKCWAKSLERLTSSSGSTWSHMDVACGGRAAGSTLLGCQEPWVGAQLCWWPIWGPQISYSLSPLSARDTFQDPWCIIPNLIYIYCFFLNGHAYEKT
jgi:hypothetical protein